MNERDEDEVERDEDEVERDEEAERLKTIERLNAGVEERLAMFEKAAQEGEAMLMRILEASRKNPPRAEAERRKS